MFNGSIGSEMLGYINANFFASLCVMKVSEWLYMVKTDDTQAVHHSKHMQHVQFFTVKTILLS